jgi:hypothetical protein
MNRLTVALGLALAATGAMAESARGGYESSLHRIEVQDRSTRRACSTMAPPARPDCLEKAAAARSASRAEAGMQLKSADVNRASGREIMAAYRESVADAERAARAAGGRKCDALSQQARGPCKAGLKATYRR